MRRTPFLNSYRATEAAGYAALIISPLCLGLVVASVAVLGETRAGWAIPLLSLIVAVALLGPGQTTARQTGPVLKAA